MIEICRVEAERHDRDESEASTVKAEGMGSFRLDASTLKCLGSSTWLNDEVVNAYMALLSLRCARAAEAAMSDDEDQPSQADPKCAFFSSFFYALLRNAKVKLATPTPKHQN